MRLRGNAFIVLRIGTDVQLVKDDGTIEWIKLLEEVKVCTNSTPKFRPLGSLDDEDSRSSEERRADGE